MPKVDTQVGQIVCDHCGMTYRYDAQRRCWSCDDGGCPHCLPPGPEPLCPQCLAGPLSGHIEPMLATLGTLPARQADWAFEYKWDGVRAICYYDGRRVRLDSRNLLDITARYPEFGELEGVLGRRTAILDGEIIALDEAGRPSFHHLQRRMHLDASRVGAVAAQVRAFYYLFDVLLLDGASTMQLPYRRRRAILEGLGVDGVSCRLPPSCPAEGDAVLHAAREQGLEGVLAKRLDSVYEPGRRSPHWVKIKLVSAQEFVIGGWTSERGTAGRIGSLLLGVYDRGHDLQYVGSVGTGFAGDDHELLLGKLRPLERPQSPFAGKVPKPEAHFVAPQLVAHVEYRRWPGDAQVQQASFKGLRADMPARQVIREKPR